jgi:ethanolaminephosphotransferase
VKPGCEKNILTHKYSAQNDSIYYYYMQGPMCDVIVSYLPWTLAPNVITVTGEICVIVAACLMGTLYGWDLEGEVPSWLCYLAGFLYFMNQTLDNCDGKQARRTGSGSPMGMLFDHGCDAMTSILSSFMGCKLFCTGNGAVALAAFILPTISFWFITL